MYDGAATWPGDSGAGLLFDEGFVVGMHLEVVDDRPDLPSLRSAGSRHLRVPDLSARLETLEASLDRASEAASSHGKACRALLLAQAPVMAAVEHARRMRGGGAGGRVLT